MRKMVDYTDLCKYDKAFRYVADVKVYSDDFALGNKGDRLQLVVSEYGFNRLLSDTLEGLIDIEASSLLVQAFDYPDISDDDINTKLERRKEMLKDAILSGKPMSDEVRRLLHEDNTI